MARHARDRAPRGIEDGGGRRRGGDGARGRGGGARLRWVGRSGVRPPHRAAPHGSRSGRARSYRGPDRRMSDENQTLARQGLGLVRRGPARQIPAVGRHPATPAAYEPLPPRSRRPPSVLHASAPVLVTPALRLTTFGGFALLGDERPLGAAVGQRRPQAVLALLAAAGEAGVSRDRLVSTLWPDADPERGRRTLTQTLYSLRRATGVDDLFLGVGDVRLNRAAVVCDTLEFERALRDGRLEEAAGLYRGPFLDGFQVPGADDFERWLEGERGRWARRCADALRTLARRARAAGVADKEIAWCDRLLALDPVDATAALALVDAHGRAGDLAGARRVARVHATLVHAELGLPLSPAIVARLAELEATLARGGAVSALPVHDAAGPPDAPPTALRHTVRLDADGAPAAGADRPTPPVIGDRPAEGPPATALPAGPSTPAEPTVEGSAGPDAAERTRTRATRSSRLRRPVLVVAGVAATALAVVVGRPLVRPAAGPARPAAPAPRADVVAVLPFALETADPSLAFLREGAADLLVRLLGDGAGPRGVASAAVLSALDAWRGAADDPSRATTVARSAAGVAGAERQRAIAVARAVGAGEVLVGRAAGTPARLTLSAVLLDAATGAERATAAVTGSADSLAALVDALAVRLVARRAMGEERAGTFVGATLPVLRAYLRAEAAYRADRYQEAMTLYEQALARDSSFAPAALGLAAAADRRNAAEPHDRALALAWAARDRLGARDRAYLLALAGPRWPAPSPADEQIDAWEQAVALAPERAEAWSELGERFFHDGALLGIRAPAARARAAFERAVALDPTDPSAARFLVELAVRTGDAGTIRQVATPARLRAAGPDLTEYLTWRVAVATGDSATLARLRSRMPGFPTPALRAIAMAAQHDAVGLADGARAPPPRRARGAGGRAARRAAGGARPGAPPGASGARSRRHGAAAGRAAGLARAPAAPHPRRPPRRGGSRGGGGGGARARDRRRRAPRHPPRAGHLAGRRLRAGAVARGAVGAGGARPEPRRPRARPAGARRPPHRRGSGRARPRRRLAAGVRRARGGDARGHHRRARRSRPGGPSGRADAHRPRARRRERVGDPRRRASLRAAGRPPAGAPRRAPAALPQGVAALPGHGAPRAGPARRRTRRHGRRSGRVAAVSRAPHRARAAPARRGHRGARLGAPAARRGATLSPSRSDAGHRLVRVPPRAPLRKGTARARLPCAATSLQPRPHRARHSRATSPTRSRSPGARCSPSKRVHGRSYSRCGGGTAAP